MGPVLCAPQREAIPFLLAVQAVKRCIPCIRVRFAPYGQLVLQLYRCLSIFCASNLALLSEQNQDGTTYRLQLINQIGFFLIVPNYIE